MGLKHTIIKKLGGYTEQHLPELYEHKLIDDLILQATSHGKTSAAEMIEFHTDSGCLYTLRINVQEVWQFDQSDNVIKIRG